jgi:RNA polymerase sigma factor (sigma-70 family)
MKPKFVNLGERLTSLRRNAHKSQQALVDECQGRGLPITRDMIASWETNRAEIPARLIPFIAHTLNAQVADLLPDLRISAFADPQRISTTPGDPTKNVQTQKPNAQAPHSARQPARFISEPANTLRRGSAVGLIFLAENETSPLDALILSETRVKLMSLIRTLHHRHRQVLLLRYFSGLKIREIAARLNLPYSNVQARLYSAFGKLRSLLYCDSRWGWIQKEFRDQFPPLEGS